MIMPAEIKRTPPSPEDITPCLLYVVCGFRVHLEGLQQAPVSPVLQLVLVPRLAQAQRGLALSVQLVVEVVQQRGSRSPLESIHTHTRS